MAEHEPDRGQPRDHRIGAEALFRDHSQFVGRFFHHMGVPRNELDDLVQEVFLIVHRKGGYVPGPGQPRTWLAAIAINLQRARLRRRNLTKEHLERATDAASLGVHEGADATEQLMSRQLLEHALDGLDLEHRAAFVLYELEGKPCEEIARALGVPLGTVYSRLHYARRSVLREYALLSAEQPEGTAVDTRRLAEGT